MTSDPFWKDLPRREGEWTVSRSLFAWVVVAVASLVGCGDENTGVLVTFDVADALRTRLESVSLSVTSAGPAAEQGRPVDLAGLRPGDLPRVVGVRPAAGDASRQAYLRIEGEGAGCSVVNERVVGFSEGEVLDMTLRLDEVCCGNPCGDGERCVAGDPGSATFTCDSICPANGVLSTFDPASRACVPVTLSGPAPPAILDFITTPAVATPDSEFVFTAVGPRGASGASYEWDLDGDGTFETTGSTARRAFVPVGIHTVRLRADDGSGNGVEVEGYAVVADSANTIEVASETDTVDATDGSVTLREALAQAQTMPGGQVITFARPMTISLVETFILDDEGTSIIGFPGVVLDGQSMAGNENECLRLTEENGGASQTVIGLEVRNCNRTGIRLGFFTENNWVARCSSHDNGRAGIDTGRTDNSRIGPGNHVYNNGEGIAVGGRWNRVEGNFAYQNRDEGIHVIPMNNVNQRVAEPVVVGNTLWANGNGLRIDGEVDEAAILHNTVHGNTADGLIVDADASPGHRIRNNIFSGNGGFAVSGAIAGATMLDNNLYFENAMGLCSGCVIGGGSIEADPMYLDQTTPDLRLRSESSAVSVAADVGEDRNGPAPGTFVGDGPDVGAWER